MWIVTALILALGYLSFDWLCNGFQLFLLSIPSGVSILSACEEWVLYLQNKRLCRTICVQPLNFSPSNETHSTQVPYLFLKREDNYTQHMKEFVFNVDTLVSYDIPYSAINLKWFASYPKNEVVKFPPHPLSYYWKKPESVIQTFQTTKRRVLSETEIMILKGLAGPLQKLGANEAKYIREMFDKEPLISTPAETKLLSRSEQRNKSRLEKVQHQSETKGGEEKLLIVRDNGEIETFDPQVF